MIGWFSSWFEGIRWCIIVCMRMNIFFISSFLRCWTVKWHRWNWFRYWWCTYTRFSTSTMKKNNLRIFQFVCSDQIRTRVVENRAFQQHQIIARMSLVDPTHQVDSKEKQNQIEYLTRKKRETRFEREKKKSRTNQVSILFSYKTKMSNKFTCINTLMFVEYAWIKNML